MYFYRDNKVILSVKSEESIYCLNYIISGLKKAVYNAQETPTVPDNMQDIEMITKDNDSNNRKPLYTYTKIIERQQREWYALYY